MEQVHTVDVITQDSSRQICGVSGFHRISICFDIGKKGWERLRKHIFSMPVDSCCIMLPDSRWFWTFWTLQSLEFTHLQHAATCRCWNHNFNHVIVWCQRSQPRRCTCVRCTWAFGVPVITYSMVKCYGYGPWVIISPRLSKFERWHLSIIENSWFVLICLLFVNNVGDRKDESCHQNHAIDSTRDPLGDRKRLRSRTTSIPSGLSTTKWFESQSI